MTQSRIVRGLLALLLAVGSQAAEPDGPYVLRGEGRLESWSVVAQGGEARKQVRPVEDGSVVVPAVGRFPSFTVKLRPFAEPMPDVVTVATENPVFVVADTHGEFEILAEMLQKHGVVDDKLRWKFGRGHLVVLGDVFDRGSNHTEILWLLYELEAQARSAGGGAHLLLGNHESMVMRGDVRYLNPKYRETARTLGTDYPKLFGADSVLGQWLRAQRVALRLNDLLLLHGGISRAIIDQGFSLAEMNTLTRAALDDRLAGEKDLERADFLLGPLGPLWYRGYFSPRSDLMGASGIDVDLTLKHFGARRIVVGHTTVPTVTALYDGRVIAVQVYPTREESGGVRFECLLIRDGNPLRAKFDGGSEPLSDSR
jgi:hypothetical protein